MGSCITPNHIHNNPSFLTVLEKIPFWLWWIFHYKRVTVGHFTLCHNLVVEDCCIECIGTALHVGDFIDFSGEANCKKFDIPIILLMSQDISHVLAVQAREHLFWLNRYQQSTVEISLYHHLKLRDVQIVLDLARLVI